MSTFEKLDVYRVTVEFDDVMTAALRGRRGPDVEQFDRARGSVIANIAEAAVQPPGANKRRIFRIALGEAAECLSLLHRTHGKGLVSADTYAQAGLLIRRVLQMLSRLAGVR